MSSQNARFNFRVGLFILTALAFFFALLVFFGGGSLFQKRIPIETYFDESVQGLEVGSKIKYRGVLVGEVSRIGFVANEYPVREGTQRRHYIYVEGWLDPALLGMHRSEGDTGERTRSFIAHGLRTRLSSQGITGVLFVELDFVGAERFKALPIDWEPRNLYVPSVPSTVHQVLRASETLITQLGKINLSALIDNLNALALTLNQKAKEIEPRVLSKDFQATTAEIRSVAQRLDRLLADPDTRRLPRELAGTVDQLQRVVSSPEMQSLPREAVATLKKLQATVGMLQRLLAEKEPDVDALIENLRQTSENLRALSEDARQYPAGVLFGDPPPRPTALQPGVQPRTPARNESATMEHVQ